MKRGKKDDVKIRGNEEAIAVLQQKRGNWGAGTKRKEKICGSIVLPSDEKRIWERTSNDDKNGVSDWMAEVLM